MYNKLILVNATIRVEPLLIMNIENVLIYHQLDYGEIFGIRSLRCSFKYIPLCQMQSFGHPDNQY